MAAFPPIEGVGEKSRPSRNRTRPRRRWGAFFFVACALSALPIAARAQISGSVDVESNYIVRGYSISAGKPAAVLNLSYDHPSGFYANGSAIFDLDAADNPAVLGGVANVGYARRLDDRITIDGGITRTQYGQQDGMKIDAGYTEGYLGLIGRNLSARLSYSPAYYVNGARVLYGELEGHHQVWAGVSLNAHLGYLKYLTSPTGVPERDDQYDWRLTASRPIYSFILFVAVSGGGPGRDYYDNQAHEKTAVMGGASWAF